MKARNSRHWSGKLAALAASTILSSVMAMPSMAADPPTQTPIKHVIVIFFENISFDHYFATYPVATNPAGEPAFTARDDTPSANNLTSAGLLTNNPNLQPPFRLDRTEAFSCDQDHEYTDEQKAFDGGLMDKFVQSTAVIGVGCRSNGSTVMGYFDGNTATALWNYAQRFSMNDNSYGTMFGPSTVGAINLASGQTGNAVIALTFAKGLVATSTPSVTITSDTDPALDDCGADAGGTKTGEGTAEIFSGKNIGDLLNEKGVTWGWFQGGFAPTSPAVLNPDGSTKTPAVCGSAHLQHEFTLPGGTTPLFVVPNPSTEDGGTSTTNIHTLTLDYVPHHEPFQYYPSTRNPHHLRPSPDIWQEVGKSDQANHQYDISDFFNVLSHGSLPAVSYLKPPKYQNAHPGNSDPLTEQSFVVTVLNALQHSPLWGETAVIINYDDSDGWYDHVMGPIVNHSTNLGVTVSPSNPNVGGNNNVADANDSLIPVLPLSTSTTPSDPGEITSSGSCGPAPMGAPPGAGRCGYGPRLPFMVISPWAKRNFIDHTVTDQTSSLRFIEVNWNLGFIDGSTLPEGAPLGAFSFDQLSGSIMNMFDFDDGPINFPPLILDLVTGEPI
jgi:phospholipase C